MHYVFESIIVGIYSVILYLLSTFIIKNKEYCQLFLVGFSKHFLSGYVKIHDFYCNYGYACYGKNDCKNGKCNSNKDLLFIESIFEGILYLIFGFIIIESFEYFNYRLKHIYLYFLIGSSLHIIFEWLQIHKYFCDNNCNKQK